MCIGEGAVTIALKINNRDARAMIDSGASRSVIDIGTLEWLGIDRTLVKDDTIKLKDASGNQMSMMGRCTLTFTIKKTDRSFTHEFRILNEKTYKTFLLGRDFISQVGPVTIDIPNNKLKLGRKWISGEISENRFRVNTGKQIKIPARTETTICVISKSGAAMLDYHFVPKLIGAKGVYITEAKVKPDIEGQFLVSIVNTNEHEVILKSRTKIGNIFALNDDKINRILEAAEEESEPKCRDKPRLGKNLTREQKVELEGLIERYSDIFAKNPKRPDITPLMKHTIDTGDAMPTYSKPRRIPPTWREEIDENVREMLNNEIIRPSKSPWNCPIILVKKKGKTRFVCDYRDLNKVTKRDTYPLPNLKDCIEQMEGTRFWTTLDAASAYWSVQLNEADKEKTAFSVPNGKYEFNVMPFGLSNSGATYQRLMDICLSGLPPQRTLAYLDDIVIFSNSFNQHLSDIEKVFVRLAEAKVSLRPEKCLFGSNEVNFLGHRLSEKGITPNDDLVEAIRSFKQPTTKKEVKRFLGTVGFYRNFIKDFAKISRPLCDLTKEDTSFLWDEKCEESFSMLKECLSKNPILAFPMTDREFIVEVDASKHAIGGVLLQQQPSGVEKPVAYFSFALSNQQQKWDTFSQETYALVVALRKWHMYLFGNKFQVRSDHNPLITIRQKKDPRGKIARWLMELEEYDFEIKHIPGKENTKADCLTRNSPENEPPPSLLDEKVYQISKDQFTEQIKEEQELDAVIKNAKSDILATGEVKSGRLKRVTRQLRIIGDILTKSGRPIVPSKMQDDVINEFHRQDCIKSHLGIDKTYQALQKRFYWPNMFKSVQNYVVSCEPCQQCKVNPKPAKAPLVPLKTPDRPMDFICIDIAYLEPDEDGYKYILLIGCMFSKFVMAVPLKDQTADVIAEAICKKWFYLHGSPRYLLSDKGSNVDGETVREVCKSLNIEKRRTSGYHAQGNGFAERSIGTALLDKQLPHQDWRSILDSLIFALNSSPSKSTQCIPFEVVFGRLPSLPMDVYCNTNQNHRSACSPKEYLMDLNVQLKETIKHVTKFLGVAREKMEKQYNTNLKVYPYAVNDKVWLEKKTFARGENKKLSPRRTGPWTIIKVYPNGVNFKVAEDNGTKRLVVHHNKLSPVRSDYEPAPLPIADSENDSSSDEEYFDTAEGDDDQLADNENEGEAADNENVQPVDGRRYPARIRNPRIIPGAIPWNSIHI